MFRFYDKSKRAPKKSEKKIQLYDDKGNAYWLEADEWRSKVLPANIKKYWNDPENLYAIIHMAFKDGFGSDVLKAASRLKEIQPDHTSYSTLGVLQIQQGLLKEAEKTFTEEMNLLGKSAFSLNYLAKIYADTGRQDQVDGMLYEALKMNPNEENALEWWAAVRKEKGGDAAWVDALKHIATFEKSWLPQLWLGRTALKEEPLLTFGRT